jgi:hypothetical protein
MESKNAFTCKSKPSSSRRDIERKVLTFGHEEAFGASALLQVRSVAGLGETVSWQGRAQGQINYFRYGSFFFT